MTPPDNAVVPVLVSVLGGACTVIAYYVGKQRGRMEAIERMREIKKNEGIATLTGLAGRFKERNRR